MKSAFKVICAWCQQLMKPGLPGSATSHAVCDTCFHAQVKAARDRAMRRRSRPSGRHRRHSSRRQGEQVLP